VAPPERKAHQEGPFPGKMNPYNALSSLFPTRPPSVVPNRIALILPCCIGDVVLATAALNALRRAYPAANITWVVGTWSRQAVEHHDLLNATLDTGPAANPARSPGDLLRFVRLLRASNFDLAVSLVRSPLVGLAVALAGIPHRAGIDSAGRGFGYTVRAPVNPSEARHEAEIYLDVVRALGVDVSGCYANVPVHAEDAERVRALLEARGIRGDYVVISPAGGSNPGMVMSSKRWPPGNFAALADGLADGLNVQIVLAAGPDDGAIVAAVEQALTQPALSLVGELTFGQIAALAKGARGYVGNDTGLTHLAAAAGARTVMILGPSDPARYAPFTPDSIALWKPAELRGGGVTSGTPENWDWERDGIGIDEVAEKTLAFLR
jgi:ADP-heptose:LPS heptosyltransferase